MVFKQAKSSAQLIAEKNQFLGTYTQRLPRHVLEQRVSELNRGIESARQRESVRAGEFQTQRERNQRSLPSKEKRIAAQTKLVKSLEDELKRTHKYKGKKAVGSKLSVAREELKSLKGIPTMKQSQESEAQRRAQIKANDAAKTAASIKAIQEKQRAQNASRGLASIARPSKVNKSAPIDQQLRAASSSQERKQLAVQFNEKVQTQRSTVKQGKTLDQLLTEAQLKKAGELKFNTTPSSFDIGGLIGKRNELTNKMINRTNQIQNLPLSQQGRKDVLDKEFAQYENATRQLDKDINRSQNLSQSRNATQVNLGGYKPTIKGIKRLRNELGSARARSKEARMKADPVARAVIAEQDERNFKGLEAQLNFEEKKVKNKIKSDFEDANTQVPQIIGGTGAAPTTLPRGTGLRQRGRKSSLAGLPRNPLQNRQQYTNTASGVIKKAFPSGRQNTSGILKQAFPTKQNNRDLQRMGNSIMKPINMGNPFGRRRRSNYGF